MAPVVGAGQIDHISEERTADLSDPTPTTTPPVSGQDAVGVPDLRSLTIAAYVLFLLGWMNGITAIVGVIIAYVKRREAAGTIWQSHFDNLILVFWMIIAGFFLGPPTLTLPLLFGFLVFPLLVFWYFYRVIRGLIRAAEGRPY
jgi:uncharacterized membrane protein